MGYVVWGMWYVVRGKDKSLKTKYKRATRSDQQNAGRTELVNKVYKAIAKR
jgi:hypothetical protein